MDVVELCERPVAYHVVGGGTGTPLLLINGGPGFDHTFLHFSVVWEALAEERPVIFFDQPGTGQSWPVGPEDTLAVADILECIEAIRTAVAAPTLAVLGHSWGGYVALAMRFTTPTASSAFSSSTRSRRRCRRPSSYGTCSFRSSAPTS